MTTESRATLGERLRAMANDPVVGPLCSALLLEAALAVSETGRTMGDAPRTDAAVAAAAGCLTYQETTKKLCVSLEALCRQLERDNARLAEYAAQCRDDADALRREIKDLEAELARR